MRVVRALLVCLLLIVATGAGAIPNAVIVNDFGDAGPGNCNTTCTLRDAIEVVLQQDPILPIAFSAEAGWPQTIDLAKGPLTISSPWADVLVISGPGTTKLSISAGNNSRVFDVVSGSLYLSALTIRDGKVTGTPGSPGDFGTGEPGGSPGITTGGCVRIAQGAIVEFEQIDVRQCVLIGGRGGNGGEGMQVFGTGGTGGVGGSGGQAAGGAIYTAGDLTLRHSSVTLSSSTGGVGGDGGAGGGGFIQGAGGDGGDGGIGTGGAVYVAEHGTLLLQNSTLAASTSTGASGGAGGASSNNTGGHGGDGGYAYGPLLHAQGAVGDEPGTAVVEFSTLANPQAVPGPGGPGGVSGGGGGTGGGVHGAAVWGGGSATFLSSVVVGASPFPLCAANVAAAPASTNIDQDSSCSGFSVHKTFAQVLRAIDPATAWSAYMPVYRGSAIDAADACTDSGGSQVVADDQRRTPRPQGALCDLGAIEADYVFFDGLEAP